MNNFDIVANGLELPAAENGPTGALKSVACLRPDLRHGVGGREPVFLRSRRRRQRVAGRAICSRGAGRTDYGDRPPEMGDVVTRFLFTTLATNSRY